MLLTVLLSMGIAAGCLLSGRILFHYFQLESYQFPGYFRTVRRNLLKSLLPGFLFMLLFGISAGLLSLVVQGKGNNAFFCVAEILILAAGGWFIGRQCSEKHAKKAFVLTARVKRLYIVSFIVLTLLLCLIIRMTTGSAGRYAAAILIVFLLFCLSGPHCADFWRGRWKRRSAKCISGTRSVFSGKEKT